jgi:hypothetical protein
MIKLVLKLKCPYKIHVQQTFQMAVKHLPYTKKTTKEYRKQVSKLQA